MPGLAPSDHQGTEQEQGGQSCSSSTYPHHTLDAKRQMLYFLRMKSVVSSKGQITLPAAVREKLGLAAGTAVRFELCEGGVVIRKGRADAHPVDQLFGTLELDQPVDVLLDRMRGPRPTPPGRRRRVRRASR